MPQPPPSKPRAHPLHTCPAGAPGFMPSAHSYAELHTTSNFTFLTGASHPDELVEQAHRMGHRAIAITDRNTLAGIVRAHVAAKRIGLPLVVGCRIELIDPPGLSVLVYPTDRAAYARLCRLLTRGKRAAPKGQCHLTLHDLVEHSAGLLGVVVPPRLLDERFIETLLGLRDVFDDDRLSLAIARAYRHDDSLRLGQLTDLAAMTAVPLVVTNDVYYHTPERRPLQDVLTCIRLGCTIEQAGQRLGANAERHLKPPGEMHRILGACPAALERTVEIAERASGFTLDQLRYDYPDEVVPAGSTPMAHLTGLTRAGALQRYPRGVPEAVDRQIQHELALIDELRYAPYFLTVHDIVAFARSRGILCQGRGAAANSAVCYCLGVTAVDPERVSVLFERFVSRERDEPPDIDIDFEHERREEVIQYIYSRYGRDRAALTAEVISYRGRSAVRDVGKAMGLSLDLTDRLAKDLEWWTDTPGDEQRLRAMGLDPTDPHLTRVTALSRQLMGFPRHLSQHVGGFVITQSPLCELVPIENAAMPDRTVIEWDKDDIEAVGMLKVDVLGLGMLTCLRKCMEMVWGHGRQDDGGSRCRCVEVSRCRGDEDWQKTQEDIDERHQIVPGPGGVAEVDAAVQGDLHRHDEHAQNRAVRSDQPDAPRCSVDPVQHRRGLQPQDPAGVHARVEDRQRIAGRAQHPVATRMRHADDQSRSPDRRAPDRDRSNALCPDPQARRTQRALTTPLPVPHSPLTPCHLDTSAPSCNPLDLSSIPPEDPAVYNMICRADTVGVFQIESRAQMSMLPRLRPRCYYDLVIEVAIVRPGPIQGDMVHPYLRRRNGEEQPVYFDDKVRAVLERTLGVPLFQEQAMSLAVVAAGFTPGEADQLRRAIAAWKTRGNQIGAFGDRILTGMQARGYPRRFAEQCFEQIKGFSGYGFPESHAASFALLVYASAWFKCHHPAAFAAALINSQPMGFYQPAQIVRDAAEHGVQVLPVDVNHSAWDCTLEPSAPECGSALRLGLRLVKGLPQRDALRLTDSVTRSGPLTSIHALRRHSGLSAASLRTLAAADAFGSLGLTRRQALWEIQSLPDEPLALFDHLDRPSVSTSEQVSPLLPSPTPANEVRDDYSSIGLSLKSHPLAFLRQQLDAMGVTPARALADPDAAPAGSTVTVAGIVLVRQRPGTASGIVFFTLEDETGIANLIVRPRIYERDRRAARHARLMLCTGRIERQGLVVHVLARRIRALDHFAPDLDAASRDFH